MKKEKPYFWLFLTNLFISAFTFGGGYVVIPMVRKYFVLQKKVMTEEELLDMAAVAQSMPGAIAVNLVSLAGYKTAGMAGAVISLFGSILPPFLILSAVSFWYTAFRSNLVVGAVLKGMEAAVAALIVDLVIGMYGQILKQNRRFLSLIAPMAFFAAFFLGIDAAWVLCGACLLFFILHFFTLLKSTGKEEKSHGMGPVS